MTPNPQQQVVINHRDGPCMVVAVPGSGKTATVTERIKTLVASGIDPRSILAITFTNKAADEMRKRVGQAVGPEKSSLMGEMRCPLLLMMTRELWRMQLPILYYPVALA